MRHCLMLDLRADASLIAQYEDWHRRVPPAVYRHLHEHGVVAMQIYRLGTRLCMVMETDDARFDPQSMAAAQARDRHLVAWERLMWRFQAPTPWTQEGRKWTAAACVFDLEWPPGAPLEVDPTLSNP
jgi:L-rhamnose mutarotase